MKKKDHLNFITFIFAAFLAGLALVASMDLAAADVLFHDDFSGLGTDLLNGTTPDVTVGSTAWVADSGYAANGAVSSAGERRAYLALGGLIDDNRGNADAIYTLSARVTVAAGSSAIWEALGFWPVSDPARNFYFSDGVAWMLRRDNAQLRVFRGSSTANVLTESTSSPNNVQGEVDLQVVLDLTTWNGTSSYGTVTYFAKLPAEPTYTEVASGALGSANSSFRAVGFSGGSVNTQLSLLQLSQLSEPLQLSISRGEAGFDFEWNSKDGKVYDMASSTDLSIPRREWPVYDPDGPGGGDPFGDIPSQGLISALSGVPAAGVLRFFGVVEKSAPMPLVTVVENLGVSGQNSSEGLASFASKLASHPDHVVIFYGMNDALNSSKLVAIPTFTNNLTGMVGQAIDAGVQSVFLVGLHPINTKYLAERHPTHPEITRLQEHVADYDAAVEQVASNTVATFIDWRTRFLAESPGTTIEEATTNSVECLMRCEANSGARDGLHPTAAGYEFLGDEVLKAIQGVVTAGDRVTCIGDSVTYGVYMTGAGTSTGDTYPAGLAQGLNPVP